MRKLGPCLQILFPIWVMDNIWLGRIIWEQNMWLGHTILVGTGNIWLGDTKIVGTDDVWYGQATFMRMDYICLGHTIIYSIFGLETQ